MCSPEISASTTIAAHLKTASNILRALRHQDVIELVLDTVRSGPWTVRLLLICPAGSTVPFILLLSFVAVAKPQITPVGTRYQYALLNAIFCQCTTGDGSRTCGACW